MKLFDPGNVVGVFRGFSDSGMEFHADLVLPYREELQSIPMHGQFVLVQLTREDEAVLGRITSVAAEGRLVSPIGEDYAIRAVRDDRPIPDELRDQYLKYWSRLLCNLPFFRRVNGSCDLGSRCIWRSCALDVPSALCLGWPLRLALSRAVCSPHTRYARVPASKGLQDIPFRGPLSRPTAHQAPAIDPPSGPTALQPILRNAVNAKYAFSMFATLLTCPSDLARAVFTG